MRVENVSRVEPVPGREPDKVVGCGGALRLVLLTGLAHQPQNNNCRPVILLSWHIVMLIDCVVFAGEQPSVQAYGAIVAGFARQRDANAALDIFRHFIAAGGAPDKMMFDTLLSLCIKCEEYKSARQVCSPSAPPVTLSCRSSAYGTPARCGTVGCPQRNPIEHHRDTLRSRP